MSATSRAARHRRIRPVVAWALAWCGALAYPVLLYLAVLNEREPTGRRLLLPAVLAVLAVPLLRRRPLPALVLMLVGSFAATVTAASNLVETFPYLAPGPDRQIGYLQAVLVDLAVAWIAATRTRWTAVAAAALALTEQIGAVLYYRQGSDAFVSTVTVHTLLLAVASMTGYLIRERREHAETVRAQIAARAVTAERLRIARELHDMVAHSIGIIAIQAGTGRRVIDTRQGAARDALAVIETTSRDTLAGLRRMLGTLRTGEPEAAPLAPTPGLADVDALAASTQDGGVRVDVEWRGTRRPLPVDVELAAFRIIQEGITNVVRHARTSRCRVVIDYREDDLSVEITDDGRGPTATGTGYGITGMRERAALLHGQFTAEPRSEGGFRVAARLPAATR